MAEVLLIYPSYTLFGKEDNLRGKESLTPSLGLALLASYLKAQDITVKVLDLRTADDSYQILVNSIKDENPVLVGITAYTENAKAAFEVARITREISKAAYITIGGPHVTALPIDTLKECSYLDAAVLGEGEITLNELLTAITSGEEVSSVPGLAIRENDNYVLTEDRPPIEDLDSMPYADWSQFDLSKYSDFVYVNLSRGCPYSCYFCYRQYLGKTRFRDPENVVAEISDIVRSFQVKHFQFTDATLTLNTAKTVDLCNRLIENGLGDKIKWSCDTRADTVDEELVSMMYKAGCRSITYGIESGDEYLLKEVIGKGETKEQMETAVQLTKKAGIEVRCHFIIGHAFETVRSLENTIAFAKKLSPDVISFGLMIPLPGTEMRRLAQEGTGNIVLFHSDWDRYNQVGYDCMELKNIPLAELKAWQSKAYLRYYIAKPLKALKLIFSQQGYNWKEIPRLFIYVVRNLLRKFRK